MKNKNGIEYSINGCRREIQELHLYEIGLRKEGSDGEFDVKFIKREVEVVVDQPWIISRATEHERKGRPWKESVNKVIGVYEGGMW